MTLVQDRQRIPGVRRVVLAVKRLGDIIRYIYFVVAAIVSVELELFPSMSDLR